MRQRDANQMLDEQSGVRSMSHQAQTDTAIACEPPCAAQSRCSRAPLRRCSAAAAAAAAAPTSRSAAARTGDPVTLDFPVFYVKRPVPDPEDDDLVEADARELRRFEIGADLFMRDRASPSAPEINLTARRDRRPRRHPRRRCELRRHQGRVLDARAVHRRRRRGRPADLEHLGVRRRRPTCCAASSRRTHVEDEGHDIMPHYLPDGRIVFTSTRQRQSRAILLDENKPQFAAQDEDDNEPAFVLHVMDDDGTQHPSDLVQPEPRPRPGGARRTDASCSRAGNSTSTTTSSISTAINPDGSDLQLLYGANSHATGTVDPATGDADASFSS